MNRPSRSKRRHMRWTRVIGIALALAALSLATFASPFAIAWIEDESQRRAEAPRPNLASPEETRAILAAVLDKMQPVGVPPPPPERGQPPIPRRTRTLILIDDSLKLSMGVADRDWNDPGDLLISTHLEGLVSGKFRKELVLANQESHPLALNGVPGTRVVPTSVIENLFKTGWWDTFYETYPDTAGYAQITRPVLTPDRRLALIFVSHHCDGLCGTGFLHLVARSGDRWIVIESEMLWIS